MTNCCFLGCNFVYVLLCSKSRHLKQNNLPSLFGFSANKLNDLEMLATLLNTFE